MTLGEKDISKKIKLIVIIFMLALLTACNTPAPAYNSDLSNSSAEETVYNGEESLEDEEVALTKEVVNGQGVKSIEKYNAEGVKVREFFPTAPTPYENVFRRDGKVIKTIYYEADHKTISSVDVLNYDYNGNIVELISYAADGVTIKSTTKNEYDANGRMIKSSLYDEKGNAVEVTIYNANGIEAIVKNHYDERGLLLESTRYKADGQTVEMGRINEYDNKGNLTATTLLVYDLSETIINHKTVYEYYDSGEKSYSASFEDDKKTEETYWDENGNKVKSLRYYKDRLSSMEEFTYNENKLASKTKTSYYENGKTSSITITLYDENENIAKETYWSDGIKFHDKYYTDGLLTKKVNGTGEWVTEYEYNLIGNLIKESEYFQGRPHQITEYYDNPNKGFQSVIKKKTSYHSDGVTIKSVSEYREDGKPKSAIHLDGLKFTEFVYDDYGKQTHTLNYNKNGKVSFKIEFLPEYVEIYTYYYDDGVSVSEVRETKSGRITKRTYYYESGQVKILDERDPNGVIKTTFYNEQGVITKITEEKFSDKERYRKVTEYNEDGTSKTTVYD